MPKGNKEYYSEATIIIPEKITVNGVEYAVTGIGDSAFSDCTNITSITIPSSVTSIGEKAFWWCNKLTGITISNGVTSIGDSAFSECTNITSITIPASVTSIGKSVFSSCENLTAITVDNSNTKYSSADGVLFDKNMTTLVAYPAGKSGSYTIPSGVTTIGERAFEYCTKLTAITNLDQITEIKEKAFSECTGLNIEFNGNSQLKTIGYNAFLKCTNITSITIPASVTSIAEYVFQGCSNLRTITIKAGATGISGGTFAGCSGLTNIVIDGGSANYKIINGILFDKAQQTLIKYLASNTTDSYNVPSTVTRIDSFAFAGCTNLKTINFENDSQLNSIGNSAFSNCSQLTSIKIPDSVTSIGGAAFNGCAGLTSIEIPDGVTSIGNTAFSGCTGLTSITIPGGVTSIEAWTFNDCTSLTSITIPDGVTSIGDAAFSGCTGIISITIPDGVTSIGLSTFSDCSSLKSITIPDGVTSIGTSAFARCSKLTNITIPANVTSIGNYAFDGCSNLTEVIYQGTFEQWNALVSSSNGNLPLNTNFTFNNLKPESETITHNSITLKTLADLGSGIIAKYHKNGGDWQTSAEFTGLDPDKEYTFEVGYFKGDTQITNAASTVIRTAKKTPSYTPPANPTIDITGKEGGTVIYDRIKHTVTITPNDDYIVKDVTLNGVLVPVTDGIMVLKNIYGGSRISVTFEPKPEIAFEPDKYISELKLKTSSSKTSKGNIRIKVTYVTDDNGNKIDLTELKDEGYTVKFKYYRSTQKASKYTAKVEKSADINSYINTSGKKGTRYYYKVRVMVYDADGSLVAKSDLKQCSYAAKTWSK